MQRKIAGQTSLDDLSRICPTISRRSHPEFNDGGGFAVEIGTVRFGTGVPVVIAGPCAVESERQMMDVARSVKAAGADMLRGGAYKPRTSPHDFQGLGLEGLKILRAAGDMTGLPVVTEVMDVRLVELVSQYADMLQIGSRSMQNYPLLVEVARSGKPVLLKRGMAASLCEWLGAAEYIANEGNLNIVLCERGIKTHAAGEYSRYSLDLNVVPAAHAETFLPVIVDPSHATGMASRVEQASRAAIEFGSDGLMIEVSAWDGNSATQRPLCDADQAINPETLRRIVHYIHRRDQATTSENRPVISLSVVHKI
ncbi:MAG: 3-deoxy-7-phosphoheptulonate synthase [Acidobacteriota bacterium]|nr:3-deoxy-7-phosphoheptulonate synthase [Acidobacteriota bacterium]